LINNNYSVYVISNTVNNDFSTFITIFTWICIVEFCNAIYDINVANATKTYIKYTGTINKKK